MRLIDADAFDERVRAAGGMSEEELTEDFKDGVQAVLYMLSKQPTIQPEPSEKCERCMMEHMDAMEELETKLAMAEPHWIPVTEDTPTEDGDYWATFEAETGRFVDWCSWYHGRWVVWLGDIPNDVSNVIAWCKPFEPYKGVTE